jgi:hypothetical protein
MDAHHNQIRAHITFFPGKLEAVVELLHELGHAVHLLASSHAGVVALCLALLL